MVGLEPDPGDDSLDSDTFGIWNGDSFGFETSAIPSLPWLEQSLNTLSMLARYGPATLWHFRELLDQTVSRYLGVYPALLDASRAFATPLQFLAALHPSMPALARESLCDFMELRHGMSEQYTREFASAVTRVQYNQNCSLNALVGMVALLPVIDDRCSRIAGGNRHLPARLLSRSNATLHAGSRVSSVSAAPGGGFSLAVEAQGPGEARSERFDIVAVAAPLELAGLRFAGEALEALNALPRREYQTTWVTMVAGEVSPLYFNRAGSIPQCILTAGDEALPFSSLCSNAVLDPEDPGWRLYKIFSKEPMPAAVLDAIFASRGYTMEWAWKAYPQLAPMPEVLEKVHYQLYPSLYYPNAMESIFSTMETEALSSLNIRNLILHSEQDS